MARSRTRPNVYAITALKRKYGERLGQSRDLLANHAAIGADLVMIAQGLEPDLRTIFSIEASMQAVLLRLARMGLIEVTGKPRRWAISRN